MIPITRVAEGAWCGKGEGSRIEPCLANIARARRVYVATRDDPGAPQLSPGPLLYMPRSVSPVGLAR
jgi:hypothetical protein